MVDGNFHYRMSEFDIFLHKIQRICWLQIVKCDDLLVLYVSCHWKLTAWTLHVMRQTQKFDVFAWTHIVGCAFAII